MSKEALFLRDMGRARAGVKEHLEGPNADIDTIIRSVRENGWAISNKLRKLFPLLGERTRADAIVQAIREALDPQAGPVIEPEGEGDSHRLTGLAISGLGPGGMRLLPAGPVKRKNASGEQAHAIAGAQAQRSL